MTLVMRVVCRGDGGPTPFDGQFLRDFDFEAHEGVGEAWMTPDVAEAMRFYDMAALHRFYCKSPACRPIRDDGKPNRPLTATTWDIFDPEVKR